MLSYTDLKKGVLFVLDGDPYEVLESSFLRMQQRKAVVQTKIRNLITGKILDRNWQASDYFEEAEVATGAAFSLLLLIPRTSRSIAIPNPFAIDFRSSKSS